MGTAAVDRTEGGPSTTIPDASTEPSKPAVAREPRRERPPRRSDAAWNMPESTTPRPKLSDREIFERLQRGEALPPIDDPTAGGDAPAGERTERPRRDRGERRERRPREPRQEAPPEPGHSRLWLNLGKLDGVDEAGLPAALEALGAPGGKVKKTELRGSYSYIHVADGDVPTFEALVGKLHNGEKALKVEKARERT
jgi:hypothetical protein